MEEYFKNNPTVNELWRTSDGQVFFNQSYAQMHADANGLNVEHSERPVNKDEGMAEVLTEAMGLEDAEEEVETPNMSWRKADITAWMIEEGIGFDAGDTKQELIDRIADHTNPGV